MCLQSHTIGEPIPKQHCASRNCTLHPGSNVAPLSLGAILNAAHTLLHLLLSEQEEVALEVAVAVSQQLLSQLAVAETVAVVQQQLVIVSQLVAVSQQLLWLAAAVALARRLL